MNQKEEKEAIDKAIKNFRGLVPTLETAIGAYFVGKKVGWKVLYLVHEKNHRKIRENTGHRFPQRTA